MLRLGDEIKIINAGSKKEWHLQPVGMPHLFYQYYRDVDLEYEPPGVLKIPEYGDVNFKILTKYYYRVNEDKNDPNTFSKRVAAFVVDTTGYAQRELELFLFPISVYNQMANAPGAVGEFSWEITKIGEGMETRYHSKQLQRILFTEAEQDIIDGTIEETSVLDVMTRRMRVYTTRKYTAFERFDILDLDD